jgi:hypothetical protein
LLNDKSVGDIFFTKLQTNTKNIVNFVNLLFLANLETKEVFTKFINIDNFIIKYLTSEEIQQFPHYAVGLIIP